jgi:ATP-dependent exoDNAse (exonuclease V) beta subunit
MTIHQSKGLEFNCVIIAELVSRTGANAIRVLTDHVDDDGTRGVFAPLNQISISPAKVIIPHDAKLAEMARAESADDAMSDLCVLYVAMTRATNSLDVFIEGMKGEDEAPTGIRSLVMQTVNTDRQGVGVETVHSYEDPAWQTSVVAKKSESRPVVEIVAGQIANSQSMHPLRWNRKSPSSLEGGDSKSLSELLSMSSQAGRERGSLIHKFCESVGWSDRGEVPSRSDLIQIAGSMGWDAQAAAQESDWFLKTISGPIGVVFERRGYPADLEVKVRREWSFATPFVHDHGAKILLTGAVDRLVTLSRNGKIERAEILDFKTDQTGGPESSDFKERINHYKPQIEAYRNAVAQIFKITKESVGASLVMLEAGVVHRAIV